MKFVTTAGSPIGRTALSMFISFHLCFCYAEEDGPPPYENVELCAIFLLFCFCYVRFDHWYVIVTADFHVWSLLLKHFM